MLFLIIVLVIVILVCIEKQKGDEQNISSPTSRGNVSSRTGGVQLSQQAPATSRVLSGRNEDYAYVFGCMVAALGATGEIQLCENGTVLFKIKSFGSKWETHKYALPQNVYHFISTSGAMTDKIVSGTRVMQYKASGYLTWDCLRNCEEWRKEAEKYFDIYEQEIKQGNSDTNECNVKFSIRREFVDSPARYAILQVINGT